MYDLILYLSVGLTLVLEIVIRGVILGAALGYLYLNFLRNFLNFQMIYLVLLFFSVLFSEKTLLFFIVFELQPELSFGARWFSVFLMFIVSVFSFVLLRSRSGIRI